MSILKMVAVSPELKKTHSHYFSYPLWRIKPSPNLGTSLQTEVGVRGYWVERRQEMLPGLLFHLLFMILWVRNSSRAYLFSRLCQLGLLDWGRRTSGGPAQASGVLFLADGWDALVSTWPFSLQMFSLYSVS